MLNYSNRKAFQPIKDWMNRQHSRCSAMCATESECSAADCGWDELHQSAIKTDCLVCGGLGRIVLFSRFDFLAIPVWSHERFSYIAPAPGVELGDCTLGISKDLEWLIQDVLDSKRSYVIVDGKTLRPTLMTPNVVPQIGEGLLVTCKFYTNLNDS